MTSPKNLAIMAVVAVVVFVAIKKNWFGIGQLVG